MTVDWGLLAFVSVVILASAQLVLFKYMSKSLGKVLNEFIEGIVNPTTKKAFSILGSQGANAKAIGNIKNEFAKGFLQKNYGLIMKAADYFGGIDIEDIIDRFGADNVLEAVQQMGPKLGFNLQDIGANFLNQQNNTGIGRNPYSKVQEH